ncbi:D-alanyl-D-alanine carboxypeptidase [Nocardioides terrae]|uniref:D-alanyl-D-alanine carboxypeptidase n=1 Tax=Nocardioides terrae TaxID=574651 RepID=A0A1I1P523_9ACTN|nr:D-alanyl-D-alanine carboxypeptidase [Nocardioides terrae]
MAAYVAGAAALLMLAACSGTPVATSPTAPPPTVTSSATPTPPPSPSPTAPPSSAPPVRPGTVPPPWLGTRVLPTTAGGYGEIRTTPKALRNRRFTLPDTVPMLPGRGFASRVTSPAPADVIARSTWVAGCPVAADDLAWVRLTFWGFDDARHTGELLVNASVADDIAGVFRDLYRAGFPIEEMRITTRAELDAPPTGDGNDTGSFNCRPKAGQTSGFSEHAYGLAIDVNPFQNPYLNGDLVLPELSSAYVDRADARPGMILAGGPVVRAFARIGWGWGGDWHALKDLQHFSQNGT